jgi:hypothetical protein
VDESTSARGVREPEFTSELGDSCFIAAEKEPVRLIDALRPRKRCHLHRRIIADVKADGDDGETLCPDYALRRLNGLPEALRDHRTCMTAARVDEADHQRASAQIAKRNGGTLCCNESVVSHSAADRRLAYSK